MVQLFCLISGYRPQILKIVTLLGRQESLSHPPMLQNIIHLHMDPLEQKISCPKIDLLLFFRLWCVNSANGAFKKQMVPRGLCTVYMSFIQSQGAVGPNMRPNSFSHIYRSLV